MTTATDTRESIRTLHLGTVETVVTLPVRFDAHAVPGLEALVEPLVDTATRINLDGSCVEHIDMAGLHSLCTLRRRVGDVVLTNASLALRVGIELSGLVDVPSERQDDILVDLPVAA